MSPEERLTALKDSAFIATAQPAVDTNRNDILDPAETTWFDANTNRLLESQEEAGITLAIKVFAQKVFAARDVNGDGQLEFAELYRSISPVKKYSPEEFVTRIDYLTRIRLAAGLRSIMGSPDFEIPGTQRPTSMKEAVEMYWNIGEPILKRVATPLEHPAPNRTVP